MKTTFAGNFVNLSETLQIAVYSRDGQAWVAERRHQRWTLHPAATWLHQAGFSVRRRMLDEAALGDITADCAVQIDKLHAECGKPWDLLQSLSDAVRKGIAAVATTRRLPLAPRVRRI